MTIMTEKETKDKKNATINLLSLMFPNSTIMFTPRSLLLKNDTGMITIDESNFEVLQDITKNIFCVSNSNNQ